MTCKLGIVHCGRPIQCKEVFIVDDLFFDSLEDAERYIEAADAVQMVHGILNTESEFREVWADHIAGTFIGETGQLIKRVGDAIVATSNVLGSVLMDIATTGKLQHLKNGQQCLKTEGVIPRQSKIQ